MKTEGPTLEEQVRCDPGAAYDFACRYLVAGLTSPGRRRAELDGHAFLVSRGEGAYLYDLRGQKYVDLNARHGGALVGHSHPAIKAALLEGLEMGTLCGQETVIPSLVARRIVEMVLWVTEILYRREWESLHHSSGL